MTLVMSKSFIEISEKINGFMSDGLCDEVVHKKLMTINHGEYEKILTFITNQKSINSFDPTYSLYKVNIFSEKVEHHIDIQSKIGNMFHTTLQADDKFIFLHCISIDTLIVFLSEHNNSMNRYIFIPVMFGSEVNKVGHFTVLIFDLIANKVYFADPNGRTSFFDDIILKHCTSDIDFFQEYTEDMYINSELLIDQLFTFYINELNSKFETKFQFIERSKWNPKKYNINKTVKDSQIGSGHCVITSTFISQYLHLTNIDVSELYAKFNDMSEGEILEIINSYSVGIYNLSQYL